jgi:putative addiction module component (TIGR02574 family)
MSVSFETIARDALDLTPRQRLKLAEVLLASANGEPESGYQASWDEEIEARILAIDDGREKGVAFEDVLAAADKLLAQ